jgi:hypothetical protein
MTRRVNKSDKVVGAGLLRDDIDLLQRIQIRLKTMESLSVFNSTGTSHSLAEANKYLAKAHALLLWAEVSLLEGLGNEQSL